MYYIIQYYTCILCVHMYIISTEHVGMSYIYIYTFSHSYIPKESSWKPCFPPFSGLQVFPSKNGTFVVALGGGSYDVAFVLAHSFSIVVALFTFYQWQGRRFDHRLKWLGKDEQSFKKLYSKIPCDDWCIILSLSTCAVSMWPRCQVVIPSQIKSVVLCNVAYFIMFLGSQQIQPKWCLQA